MKSEGTLFDVVSAVIFISVIRIKFLLHVTTNLQSANLQKSKSAYIRNNLKIQNFSGYFKRHLYGNIRGENNLKLETVQCGFCHPISWNVPLWTNSVFSLYPLHKISLYVMEWNWIQDNFPKGCKRNLSKYIKCDIVLNILTVVPSLYVSLPFDSVWIWL